VRAGPGHLGGAAGGLRRRAQLWIFIKRYKALETSRAVNTVVLDKTGTVTTGVMAVTTVQPAAGVSREISLRYAGAVEQAWSTRSPRPSPRRRGRRRPRCHSRHLTVGEFVVTVAVSFEDPATRQPIAHTTTVLRPDRLRVVIQTAELTPAGRMDDYASARTRVVQVIALTSHQLSR
jgi:magnesium-transporting ATPase (P-type)